MIVKKITSNKLYLETEEIIDISPDIIYEFKLKKDMDITSIYEDILFESIKQKAFFYIYLKPRTKYELNSKLKLKYKNYELIVKVLDFMEEYGYIDDVDYALSYILTHRDSRAKNTMKLMQKGIKKEHIDLAYDDVPEGTEDSILEKEIDVLMDKNYEIAKIFLKLTRKGYNYSKIKEILDNKKKNAH